MPIEFSAVARRLACKEFAEAEGLKMRGGRAVCPFHAGADGYNLAFYPDGRAHCHRCGRTADVVQLASAVWGMNQRDTAVELNRRFKLGLTGETVTQAEQDRREQARQEARDLREQIRRAEVREWGEACEAERTARERLERFGEADAETAAFTSALRRLCEAQLRADNLQAARREAGQR